MIETLEIGAALSLSFPKRKESKTFFPKRQESKTPFLKERKVKEKKVETFLFFLFRILQEIAKFFMLFYEEKNLKDPYESERKSKGSRKKVKKIEIKFRKVFKT